MLLLDHSLTGDGGVLEDRRGGGDEYPRGVLIAVKAGGGNTLREMTRGCGNNEEAPIFIYFPLSFSNLRAFCSSWRVNDEALHLSNKDT